MTEIDHLVHVVLADSFAIGINLLTKQEVSDYSPTTQYRWPQKVRWFGKQSTVKLLTQSTCRCIIYMYRTGLGKLLQTPTTSNNLTISSGTQSTESGIY